MGARPPKYLEDEKMSLKKPHKMEFSSEKRKNILDKFEKLENSHIYYGFYYETYEGFKFKQYFIKYDENYLVYNFNGNIYNSYVDIIETIKHKTEKKEKIEIDEKIKERMKIVIGFNNFSFCLRNSEHIFNYVIKGLWESKDMMENGEIYKQFQYSIRDCKKFINSFPSYFLEFENSNKKLYPFIEENFKFSNRCYYLDYQENTFNILVLGTTGVGKSNLINILFNREVVTSKIGVNSVSKDVIFLRGTGKIGNDPDVDITVADTIGFCDSEIKDDNSILNLIKSRIDSNMRYYNLIIIVIKPRMENNHLEIIKKAMKVFNYDKNNERFIFVSTHFNELDKKNIVDEEKNILCEKLSIYEKHKNRIVMMDNMKSTALNNYTQKEFNESLDNLKKLFVDNGKNEAVSSKCLIF